MKNDRSIFRNWLLTLSLLVSMALPAWAGPLRVGDLDGNDLVDVADVSLMISQVLGKGHTVDVGQADLNGDGTLDVADVSSLIGMVLGKQPQVKTTQITVNGVSFKMVLVQGGTFIMGSKPTDGVDVESNECPAHEVTIGDYYIAETEVTQELWLAVMGDNPSHCQDDPRRPVENVSMFDCAKFVDRLTELTGKVFRLPTEAEWEYAARGASMSRGYAFAGSDDVNLVACYGDGTVTTPSLVTAKRPNELGLYDMSGNVMEWCQDFYSGYDEFPQVNPVGPESGKENIIRGGAWDCPAPRCRVAARDVMSPQAAAGNVGLRLAMNT